MKTDFFEQNKARLSQFIASALAEDIGSGDHSTNACLPEKAQKNAQLFAKQKGIVAGITLAEKIFKHYDPTLQFESTLEEGAAVENGSLIFEIAGNARSILATERLVLNCMQRMSGVAYKTKQLQQMIAHTQCQLLDTRKTTPNFRLPEKWAVQIGGGTNHRMGLYDALMIKDNHVDFCGSLKKALEKTKSYLEKKKLSLPVIVEIRSTKELQQAAKFPWISRLLLDNHTPTQLKEALYFLDGKFTTEASGNIQANTIIQMAETGVDYLSLGALTYNTTILDMSLQAKNE